MPTCTPTFANTSNAPARRALSGTTTSYLVHLPLFHIYGMTVLQLNAIAAGATQVMMGRFDMELLLSLIAQHRVSALFTVPPVSLGLSLTPLLDEYDVSSLRFVLCGAAPLSAELQVRVQQRLGCPVIQGYGLTETSR